MNHSHQRDLIMDFLKGTTSHPTAEEVYEVVRKSEPNISLGTVYRNLNLLADNKMILRLHMENGIDHFDADISEHYHYFCNSCGRIYDLAMKPPVQLSKVIKSADKVAPGHIEGCTLYFYGKCANC